MARRLRLQDQGALYHVINRGNYRRDVFETSGAARSFEATLMEACDRHRWRLGKSAADIERDPKGVDGKIAVASRLRHEATAPHRWIARALNMGSPASVRVYLCRKN